MDIWPLPIKSANFDTVFDSVKFSSRLRFLTARENIWTFRDARTRRNLKSTSKLFRPSVSKMLAALCCQPIAGLALQTHCCRSLSLSVPWEGYILSICRGINMLWSGHERHRNSEIRMTNPYAVEWSWKTSKFWNKDDEPLSHVFHWIAPFFSHRSMTCQSLVVWIAAWNPGTITACNGLMGPKHGNPQGQNGCKCSSLATPRFLHTHVFSHKALWLARLEN